MEIWVEKSTRPLDDCLKNLNETPRLVQGSYSTGKTGHLVISFSDRESTENLRNLIKIQGKHREIWARQVNFLGFSYGLMACSHRVLALAATLALEWVQYPFTMQR